LKLTAELLERYSLVGQVKVFKKYFRPFGPAAHDTMRTTTIWTPRMLKGIR